MAKRGVNMANRMDEMNARSAAQTALLKLKLEPTEERVDALMPALQQVYSAGWERGMRDAQAAISDGLLATGLKATT